MKTVALAVLAVLSISLGVLLAQEKAQTHRLATRLAELDARVSQQHAEIQTQSQQVASLGEEKTRLTAKIEATKQKLAAAREAAKSDVAQAPASIAVVAEEEQAARDAAKAEKSSDKKGSPLKGYMANVAKMMKDPAMKQMVRATQSTAMRQMYGDLVKQWNLSPDDAGKFYDQILDKQMSAVDQQMNAMDKGSNATASAASSVEDADAQLKASLGDTMYQQYKDYEKTVADRMTLNQYQQRLVADNAPPLTNEQSQFLVRAMSEERQSQAAANNGQPVTPFDMKDGSFTADPSKVDSFLQRQAELNDRVAQRASSLLSAPQLDAFKQYQKQTLDMQRMGMAMMSKMNDSGGNP